MIRVQRGEYVRKSERDLIRTSDPVLLSVSTLDQLYTNDPLVLAQTTTSFSLLKRPGSSSPYLIHDIRVDPMFAMCLPLAQASQYEHSCIQGRHGVPGSQGNSPRSPGARPTEPVPSPSTFQPDEDAPALRWPCGAQRLKNISDMIQ